MAQAYFSLITNAGKTKLAQSAAGGAAVVITHFAIGDGNGADTNPTAASTALVREIWRTPVESVATDPDNPSAILVTAIIPTQVGGWWMREFGIFDQAGAMIAVAKPVSQYKPTAQEGQLEDIRYEFQIVIGENANVTLLVDPSILLASREWVMSRKIPMAQMMRTPWLAVNSMTVTAPPASPAQGDAYLVPAGATGAWAANIGRIAEWSGTAWSYAVPTDGHGIGLPDGRIFERIGGAYVEFLASRDWVNTRITAVTKLNRLPWLAVNSMTVTAPPASPAQGDTYLVPAGATGAWAANIGRIAEWSGTAWSYAVPTDGHGIALPDGRLFERVGGAYIEKLALDAQSGRWTYAVVGGTANALTATLTPAPIALVAGLRFSAFVPFVNLGPVTLDLNVLGAKNVVDRFGRGLSGGEMIGLVDFVYDGTKFWSSVANPPSLVANRPYYVNALTGNDSNSGLSASAAFATIQRAVDVVSSLDLNGFVATISVANGAYSSFQTNRSASGGTISIVGNNASPQSVVVGGVSGSPGIILAHDGYTVSGFTPQGAAGQSNISVFGASATVGTMYHVGTSGGGAHIACGAGGSIFLTGSHIMAGGAAVGHLYAADSGVIRSASVLPTMIFATTALSFGAFVVATNGDINVLYASITGAGNAIGPRYAASLNGVINTNGSGENYYPGSLDGTKSTGGQYA
ncbi:phage tail protein [Rhizobium sp. FY34]|uniref:phage tail-collar fiber domain-containing protein n=1 Tax=Rhizobium sp. FY34 TaxID=2562309 RepID=UPI0010BF6C34|nr:phage tail protein [Rhizobium sp. FY34]